MKLIQRHATISPCGKYRYLLTREWADPLLMPTRACSLAFIMLNPSTADGMVDDPTIRRCMNFARREGYYGIAVVNLFAYRATDPKTVCFAKDPVGPNNDDYIKRCLSYGDVIAAWGSEVFARSRAREVQKMLAGVAIKCLGMNKDGSPKHPLYVPKNTLFTPWSGQ